MYSNRIIRPGPVPEVCQPGVHWCHSPVHQCSTHHSQSLISPAPTHTRRQHFYYIHSLHITGVTRQYVRAPCITRSLHTPGGSTFLHKMTSILKVWHQIKNLTQSIDVYLPEEQSCQISSWSDLKQWSLGMFLRSRPNKNKKKMSSDVRSVHDLQIS